MRQEDAEVATIIAGFSLGGETGAESDRDIAASAGQRIPVVIISAGHGCRCSVAERACFAFPAKPYDPEHRRAWPTEATAA